jgi:hypothetical protein
MLRENSNAIRSFPITSSSAYQRPSVRKEIL